MLENGSMTRFSLKAGPQARNKAYNKDISILPVILLIFVPVSKKQLFKYDHANTSPNANLKVAYFANVLAEKVKTA